MKIRTKISIWIIVASICASIVLSAVVFYGLYKGYYRVIDRDLEGLSSDIAKLSVPLDDIGSFLYAADEFHGITRYWGEVYTADRKTLWQTPIARKIKIPLPDTSEPFTFHTGLLVSDIDPELPRNELLVFRVKLRSFMVNGSVYSLLIGKSIENFGKEIQQSAWVIAGGLCIAVVISILLSSFFAGRILKPLTELGLIANNIDDKTLDQRIPLRPSRDEFNHFSKILNGMLDRLQVSFDKQKQLLSDASHELRSPITLLRLQIEERLQDKDLPEEFRSQFIRHEEILHRMSRLISSLLDLSALEIEGLLEMSEVVISDLVRSVLDDFSDLIHAENITVQKNIPAKLTLQCDAEKIRRVIVNLVDNAIKYNQKGGRLKISAVCSGAMVCISVYNTGLGIPEEELPRIFDQFYRVEPSRSRMYGGSGLGLAIVKSVIELHGGRVEAASRFGEWTRIDVFLP